MEFFEVITLIPHWDNFGHEHLEEQHEAYFEYLENAYEYCLDRYKGTEELPLLSEIEDKFYPQVENDFNVGDFTIKKLYFDDSYQGGFKMDWHEIKREFEKKFPDYFVYVVPSCISENRECEYRISAMETALGYKTNDRVSIDNEKKRVYYFR